MNLFWCFLALSIIIAFAILPRKNNVSPNISFYYGGPGLVREGMNTLRKTTMTNYPYDYATHPPTGWAKNNAIDDYYKASGFNDSILANNEYLVEDSSQIHTFNSCA